MEIGTTEILIVIMIVILILILILEMPCHALRVSGSRPSTS